MPNEKKRIPSVILHRDHTRAAFDYVYENENISNT